MKNPGWLFVGPVAFALIFVSAGALGDFALGPGGHPSGGMIGVIYAAMSGPVIGIFGALYAVRAPIRRPPLVFSVALALNICVIAVGATAWVLWFPQKHI